MGIYINPGISEAKRKNDSLRVVPDMIVEAVWDEVAALDPGAAQTKTLNDSLIRFVECSFGRKFIFIIDEWDAMIREVKHDATLKRLAESEQLFIDTIHRNEIAVAAQIEKIHAEEYPDAVRNIGCPILLVGISYDKNTSAGEKKHTCRIVEL